MSDMVPMTEAEIDAACLAQAAVIDEYEAEVKPYVLAQIRKTENGWMCMVDLPDGTKIREDGLPDDWAAQSLASSTVAEWNMLNGRHGWGRKGWWQR